MLADTVGASTSLPRLSTPTFMSSAPSRKTCRLRGSRISAAVAPSVTPALSRKNVSAGFPSFAPRGRGAIMSIQRPRPPADRQACGTPTGTIPA